MKAIYKISSIAKPTRIYVGSAINFENRKSVHLCELKNKKHGNVKLQRHFNKYGKEDLVFSIIEPVENREELIQREQFYIDTFLPYFNICPTAGSNLGRKFGPQSLERRQATSKRHRGVKKTGTSEKLSIPIYKYDLSGNLVMTYKSLIDARKKEGMVIKISNNTNKTIGDFVWVSSKGVVPDFKKLSESLSNWRKERCLPVLQIDKQGNIVKEFSGVRVASRETGIDHRSIQSVAAGSNPKRHTAGGFKWVYKNVA